MPAGSWKEVWNAGVDVPKWTSETVWKKTWQTRLNGPWIQVSLGELSPETYNWYSTIAIAVTVVVDPILFCHYPNGCTRHCTGWRQTTLESSVGLSARTMLAVLSGLRSTATSSSRERRQSSATEHSPSQVLWCGTVCQRQSEIPAHWDEESHAVMQIPVTWPKRQFSQIQDGGRPPFWK